MILCNGAIVVHEALPEEAIVWQLKRLSNLPANSFELLDKRCDLLKNALLRR